MNCSRGRPFVIVKIELINRLVRLSGYHRRCKLLPGNHPNPGIARHLGHELCHGVLAPMFVLALFVRIHLNFNRNRSSQAGPQSGDGLPLPGGDVIDPFSTMFRGIKNLSVFDFLEMMI